MTPWIAALMIAAGIAVAGWAVADQRRPARRVRLPVLVVATGIPALTCVTLPTLGVLFVPIGVAALVLAPPRRQGVRSAAHPGSS